MQRDLTLRITGFLVSLALTLIAYLIITEPQFFQLSNDTVIATIFTLALIQAVIQLMFFINVWKEEGPLWNLAVFISTVSIMFIVIFFSIWIMNHLNYNMR